MKKERIFSIRSEQLEGLRQRLQQRHLLDSDWDLLDGVLIFLFRILRSAEEMRISLGRLQNLLFGKKTENSHRNKQDPPPGDDDEDPSGGSPTGAGPDTAGSGSTSRQDQNRSEKHRPSGHGRMGASAYLAARTIHCSHPDLQAKQPCPCCRKGTLYLLRDPSIEIRIIGSPVLTAREYERERLRCSSCGAVLTAPLPADAPLEKYDARAKVLLAVLKYGYGMPFYRLGQLQGHLGVPLPPATQWQLVEEVANAVFPIYRTLKQMASQAEVLYADDSPIRILSLMAENEREPEPERKGRRTTVLIADLGEHSIYLYESGRQHAGDHLGDLLQRRPRDLAPPIQMTDALASNTSHPFQVIVTHCLLPARRLFFEIKDFFPELCRRVIEDIAQIYHFEDLAKKQGLNPDQRLAFHQQHSGPVLEGLKSWLEEQWDQKQIEPNSSLGKATRYLLGHWEQLTGFLRIPAAPLDNNPSEHSLKLAILNRKNSYFFKTQNGADVGSVLMSLIKTAIEAGANPVEYRVTLLEQARQVRKEPQLWLPWNYGEQRAAA
jgi:transposase